MRLNWLLRMSQWARNPPSERRVILWAAVIAACLAVVFAEWMGWLPEWFALDPKGMR